MLSFGKIMVIVAVAVGALIAFRVFGHMGKIAAHNKAREPERREEARREAQRESRTADLASCPKCKVYTETPCGQPDCPLRR